MANIDDKNKDSFEGRLQRLEHISESIRSGEADLEEATNMFEEGIELARSLEKELSAVEGRIERLVKAPGKTGEKAVSELFPELSENGQ